MKSDPDGYTLLVQSSSHAANPAIYKSLPYDPVKDLVDVALLGVTPYVMVTQLDGPYKTIKLLVDAAKAWLTTSAVSAAARPMITRLRIKNGRFMGVR